MNQRTQLIDRIAAVQPRLRRRFVEAMTPGLRDAAKEVDAITVHQLEVLRRVLDDDGMTMHDVAQVLGVGPSSATQLVDRLEQRGLVTRERDTGDRRVQRVVPTERARALGEQFRTRMRIALENVLAGLDEDELRTYVQLAERLAGADAERSRHGVRRSA
jgi:DNA-binding MarR family transcriptional regulator